METFKSINTAVSLLNFRKPISLYIALISNMHILFLPHSLKYALKNIYIINLDKVNFLLKAFNVIKFHIGV